MQDQNPPGAPGLGSSKIQHKQPGIGGTGGLGSGPAEPGPVPVAESNLPVSNKIKSFEKTKRHEEAWNRTPNTTGTGAIHVKTFHCKLTDDALAYMDQVVNEWLDAHPQYEVKFVNSCVGTLTGKLKEPNLLCQVWV